jgi:hypothetical protein
VVASPQDALVCTIGEIKPKSSGQLALKNCTGTPPANPVTEVRITSAQGSYLATIPPTDLAAILAAPATPTPATNNPPVNNPPANNQPVSNPPATGRPEGAPMKVSGSMSGGFGPARRITINNESSFSWSGCRVTVNSDYFYSLGELAAGSGEGIMMVRFKDANGNVLTSNAQILKAEVRCKEGSVSFTPR